MTPDESIKRLTTIITPAPGGLYPKETEAIQLGISALQAILFARSGGSWDPQALLPGETTEPSTYAQERIPSLPGISPW